MQRECGAFRAWYCSFTNKSLRNGSVGFLVIIGAVKSVLAKVNKSVQLKIVTFGVTGAEDIVITIQIPLECSDDRDWNATFWT